MKLVLCGFLYDCEHETAIFSLYDQSQEAAVLSTAWENGASTEQAPAASIALSTVADPNHQSLHN